MPQQTADLDRLVDVDDRFHVATLAKEFRTNSTASRTQLLDMKLSDGDTLLITAFDVAWSHVAGMAAVANPEVEVALRAEG